MFEFEMKEKKDKIFFSEPRNQTHLHKVCLDLRSHVAWVGFAFFLLPVQVLRTTYQYYCIYSM